MCGILGTVNYNLTDDVVDGLAHRGPDGSGVEKFIVGSHSIFMGHRRLAIVDLSSNGAQPMKASAPLSCLIYNGELYNHSKLRSSLDQVFCSNSDTESLFESLRKYYTQCLPKLNGIFSFGYLDSVRQKLLLVRDPFGVKPLYYYFNENYLLFSSEIAPIINRIKLRVDLSAISSLYSRRFIPSPNSPFLGLRRLQPGHYLEVDLGKRQLSIRCEPYIRNTQFTRVSDADLGKKFSRVLENSVEQQLMSDVDVGVLLSGGVDSAVIAKIAKIHSKTPIKAFTVGFADGGNYDEISDAAQTAKHLNIPHYYKKIEGSEFFDILRCAVIALEEPTATSSIVPMYSLSALASSQVKVVLSGQGADEIFGGYSRYQFESISSLLRRVFSKSSLASLSSFLRSERQQRLLRGIGSDSFYDRFDCVHRIFDDAQIDRLFKAPVSYEFTRDFNYWQKLLNVNLDSSVSAMMQFDSIFGLVDDLLLYTDKISMRHSLECRVPFLDQELVSFSRTLADRRFVSPIGGKLILKKYAMSVLPSFIVNRPKRGFSSPFITWVGSRDDFRDFFGDRRSPFYVDFSFPEVFAFIDKAFHFGVRHYERELFLLISTKIWYDEFVRS